MKFINFILISVFISYSFNTFAQSDEKAKAYIERYKGLAMGEQQRTGIPAAIKLAQGLHETGYGESELCQNANNHFGIKCKKNWTGDTYTYTDDRKDECFRKYNDDISSYKDHSDFLHKNPRYSQLFTYEVEDYTNWSNGLKQAGYATNPHYANRLIATIEKYNLNQYTIQAKQTPEKQEVYYASASNNIDNLASANTTTQKNTAINHNTAIVKTADSDITPPGKNIEFYTIKELNGIKGFYAPEGSMLLEQAIKNRIRYSKLLELNELPDEPLEADMFIYLDKKHKKGLEATTVVASGETLIQVSQRTGVLLSQLKTLNKLVDGVEPEAGSTLQLQNEAVNPPAVYIPSKNNKQDANNTQRVVKKEEDAYITLKSKSAAAAKEVKEEVKETTQAAVIAVQEEKDDIVAATKPKLDIVKEETKEIIDDTKEEVVATTKVIKREVKEVVNPKQEEKAPVVETNTPKTPEDDKDLSPYERLKRHMDKQVNNNSSYYENQKTTEATEVYITQPANSTPKATAASATTSQKTSTKTGTTQYHTVAKGETLFSIANKYGVTVDELQTWNKVTPRTLQAGKRLIIKK